MGQPGTQLCVNELSGNGTTPRHATTPEVKNHHRWIANGFALGRLRSTQASISLLTRTLPLAPETVQRGQPACYPSRVQTRLI
jgi:hypothetical protein